ncbi:MAG: tRNA (adenosine(37)-N6)-threonylcarbamoyltransferase complex dimerization subunit type 1 TsaB [Burkholderiaceae bacterium]
MNALLAFDTATERMSVALAVGAEVSVHEAAGGALASATLLPVILDLLARAGLKVRDLDAIAFGRGPGAFTGLRTACSVAQGLALGAAKPVLPIDTLLAVAEDARTGAGAGAGASGGAAPLQVWVAMDARMGEIYAAQYAFANACWQVLDAPMLITPEALNQRWAEQPPKAVAGSALGAFGARLRLPHDAACFAGALPRAAGMIPLARALSAAGGAVDAALALPLYLRDKVAQTSAERDAVRAARADAAEPLQ